MDSQAEVVIIGGGIMGCAAAYYLAQRGTKAVLLEKGRIAGEQSSRNWGWVRQRDRDLAELPLMVASNRLWRELSSALEADIEWCQSGNLALAADAARLAYLEQRARVEQEFGVDSRMVTPERVQELVPGITGRILGGLYTPSDGHADPLKATTAFAAAAQRLGATVHEYRTVNALEASGGRIARVHTDNGTLTAGTVILASGAHTPRLLRDVGLHLPLRRTRASVGATVPLPPLTQVAVAGEGISFRQMANGQVVLGRSGSGAADYDITLESFRDLRYFLPNFLKNRHMLRLHFGAPFWADLRRALPGSAARRQPFAHTVDVEPEPNRELVEQNRQAFMRYFPQLGDVKLERSWAGVIDTTPDVVPVLGAAPGVAGLIIAAGFSGHGFGMGPIAGKLLSELVLDGAPSLPVDALRLSRFAEGQQAKARRLD